MIEQQKLDTPETILVIDDETYIADAVSAALTREGYTALAAYDGIAGRALLEQEPVRLLILDLMMPIQHGEDVFRMVRADPRFATLPIVVISAGGGPVAHLVDAYTRFLPKPFYLDDLIDAVRSLLTLSEA